MHLHATPGLAAEVPGFSQAQLDSLARSVEARRRQLEEDIAAYIARKQEELHHYEAKVRLRLLCLRCDYCYRAFLHPVPETGPTNAA